jgi:hypothetical protein
MTSRNKMWVTCPPCKWTWIVAYLPMEMTKLARLMKRANCPKCGAGKDLKMATNADIEAALARSAP